MTRVVWTNEEKRALRDCMIDICYVTPTMSNKGLLKHAQEEVLPYERRQKITDQRVFNYKPMFAEARKQAEAHRAKVTAKPKQPEPPVPVTATINPPSVGELFEQLIDAVTKRVMRQVIEHMHPMVEQSITLDELDKTFDRLYPEWKKTPLQPSVPRKPTCLVVGLNGAQMESIKQRVPHVDFKFLTAEEAVSHYTFHKDHTVLMTKFLNHSAQGKYRKHPNLHYCNGGVTELNNLLNGVFKKEVV